ncbi:hypothetical protein IQ229_00915 [Nostoc cf. edaphicum LEGE 07299]|uniref:histidine kinase n=1 Tax=Nostoc cf. edaphicum LEGE 07299 TaxID=2777974 RepID=A0ABR9TT28_9NOSO|nr:hypothetical protein [Nostoc cf. edaphicum LEGE 07299]
MLLVLQDPTLEILQVSSNSQEVVGRQPDELLGKPLSDLLNTKYIQLIQQCLAEDFESVQCDRAQINELFSNLISNAIKYNDKPEKWVEIGFIEGNGESKVAPTSVTFYVRDNGIDIPQEHLDKIFQIFRRLHGRDDFGGGTGVGLTIARKIVERHGGRIWVESTPTVGSTFYFTLSAEANT